jgi:phosphate/sulfate permease
MKKHEPFVALKAFLIAASAILLSEWIEGPMSMTVSIIGVVIGFWVFLHGMSKD